MGNGLSQIVCEPSRPFFRPARQAAWAESARLAAEMQQFFRATARALDTGEAVHGIPAIEEPVHHAPGHTAQRPAGMLETLFIGAEEVPPMVAQDFIENILSKTAGAVSHGVCPADDSQPYQQGKTGAGGWK